MPSSCYLSIFSYIDLSSSSTTVMRLYYYILDYILRFPIRVCYLYNKDTKFIILFVFMSIYYLCQFCWLCQRFTYIQYYGRHSIYFARPIIITIRKTFINFYKLYNIVSYRLKFKLWLYNFATTENTLLMCEWDTGMTSLFHYCVETLCV